MLTFLLTIGTGSSGAAFFGSGDSYGPGNSGVVYTTSGDALGGSAGEEIYERIFTSYLEAFYTFVERQEMS